MNNILHFTILFLWHINYVNLALLLELRTVPTPPLAKLFGL
jgi:hypothetical protein